MRTKELGVVIVASAIAGVAAALAVVVIVTLTGSEAVTPMTGGIMGAAVGISAGAVIGRTSLGMGARALVALLQAVVAGGVAALVLWLLQRR